MATTEPTTAAHLDTCEHKQCIPFDRCLYGDNAGPTQPLDTAACACNRAMMAALSPMHPFHYIELACDEHRREFQQASLSDSIRDYEPHNEWRSRD